MEVRKQPKLTSKTDSHGDKPYGVTTHVVCAKQCSKCVWLHMFAHGKLVRYLKQRRQAHGLCDVGAKAGMHIVGKGDLTLDLLAERLDGAGVGEAELGSPIREGPVRIAYGIGDGIGGQKAQGRRRWYLVARSHDGEWQLRRR